jgi:hypothetical protein
MVRQYAYHIGGKLPTAIRARPSDQVSEITHHRWRQYAGSPFSTRRRARDHFLAPRHPRECRARQQRSVQRSDAGFHYDAAPHFGFRFQKCPNLFGTIGPTLVTRGARRPSTLRSARAAIGLWRWIAGPGTLRVPRPETPPWRMLTEADRRFVEDGKHSRIVCPKAASSVPKIATFRDGALADAADDCRRLKGLSHRRRREHDCPAKAIPCGNCSTRLMPPDTLHGHAARK